MRASISSLFGPLMLSPLTFPLMVYVLYSLTCVELPSATVSNGPRVVPSLRFLIVMSRHGERAPLYNFPTNPYPPTNRTIWPEGKGQLTVKGRTHMYNLGKKIRSLYDGFIGQFYYADEFKAQSTVSDRTLMSAQVFLAGMFPPKGFQVWNPHINWQPIPIFTHTLDHSRLIPVDENNECPAFQSLLDAANAHYDHDPEVNATQFMDSIRGYSGQSMGAHIAVRHLYDTLSLSVKEGLELPPWAKGLYPEPLNTLMGALDTACIQFTEKMPRFLEGPLFQEIVGLLESKANYNLSPDRRMFYFSNHDTTIQALKSMLGLKDLKVVEPSSALIFELHHSSNTRHHNHYVEVLYIDGNSPDLEPTTVSVAECDPPCDIETFMRVTEKYYNITDYEAECHEPQINTD